MFLLFLPLLLSLTAFVVAVPFARSPADWHTVEWAADDFLAFSGDFVIPNLPNDAGSGIIFVWPGLQGDTTTLQAVLDARSGLWTLGNEFFGTLSRPLGDRFDVQPGDTVHFEFSRLSVSDAWTSTLSGPHGTSATLSIPGIPMTRAILAVELTDVDHDFSVIYNNLILTAASAPAREWCPITLSRGYENSYTVINGTADGPTCRISSIVLPATAESAV